MDPPRGIPLRHRSPPRSARDNDYVVRARPRTLSLDPQSANVRRPLSLMEPRSPNRTKVVPLITRDMDRPSSPLSKTRGAQLEESYIIPASSSAGRHHLRHSSLTDPNRLVPRDRERERLYAENASRSSGVLGRSTSIRQPPIRESNYARDQNQRSVYKLEPRGEILKEPETRRVRRDSYNSGRPVSMIGLDRMDPENHRSSKDTGPPVSSRGFGNLGKAESLRQRAREDDPESRRYSRDDHEDPYYRNPARSEIALHQTPDDRGIPYAEGDLRHQRPRKPAVDEERVEVRPRPRKPIADDERPETTRQDLGADQHLRIEDDRSKKLHGGRKDYNDIDDSYRKSRDQPREKRDKDELREQWDRDEPRDKRVRGDESGLSNGLIAGAGAAAVAGLATDGTRRRQRQKEYRDEDNRSAKEPTYLRELEHDRMTEASESTSLSGDTRVGGEPEDREERRVRRRREREREERDYQEARDAERRARNPDYQEPREPERSLREPERSTREPEQLAKPPENKTLRESASYERHPDPQAFRPHRSHRHRRHHSRARGDDSYSDPSSLSSDSGNDTIEPQPRVVTPSNENRPEPRPPPKGILRKPREKFPEPPNPVREGVAPLDAAKKGIPPSARWTRINRKLVNPEALEQEGVRFEEYADHVIVLKVLSQEEINKYTAKTYEIREKRRLAGLTGPEGKDGSDVGA